VGAVTYPQFIIKVTEHYGNNRRALRFGQAVFNVLDSMRPDIANELRGSSIDPFYKDSVPREVWEFIKERW
jgi:hypothetical protein